MKRSDSIWEPEAVRDVGWRTAALGLGAMAFAMACNTTGPTPREQGPRPLDPELVAEGREIFRFDTFGDEVYWTDTLRMHEVVEQEASPAVALSVGLKVDAEALPQELQAAIAAREVDLNDPATTLALLELDAVLGLKGWIEEVEGGAAAHGARHHVRALPLDRG